MAPGETDLTRTFSIMTPMDYEVAIGLETHVQLKTNTKMWCGCPNEFGADPNTNVCPVCLGMPGVLPVANKEAMEKTTLTGLLLNGEVRQSAKFDRKNYFYPDLPKNYQITQYDAPSVQGGHVDFEFNGEIVRVRIVRVHLEEDVGKSFHFERHSGIDFNRAGAPLLEIVSEPDLTSAEMAYTYLNALKDILVYGGVSDCDMEKGMVRCDVNVSVRPKGQEELGAKVEIKNMNTFSGARKALAYEIDRQQDRLMRGERIEQQTRRWDDVGEITELMRTKEEAHDYRYFPEPDLMPFEPPESRIRSISERVVELPLAKKQRLMAEYSLPASDAAAFVNDPVMAGYFESIAHQSKKPKAVANFVINNLRAKLTETETTLEEVKFSSSAIPELVELIDSDKISTKIAQEVFNEMFDTGESPNQIVDKKGLAQVTDTSAVEQYCDQAIEANPKSAQDYRDGKEAALNFLKGQVMKLSQGKANPKLVGETLDRKLRG